MNSFTVPRSVDFGGQPRAAERPSGSVFITKWVRGERRSSGPIEVDGQGRPTGMERLSRCSCMMSVLRSRQGAKLRRQNRQKTGMGSGPGERVRGATSNSTQPTSFNNRRRCGRYSKRTRLFSEGPRALIGTTDTNRAGELGVPGVPQAGSQDGDRAVIRLRFHREAWLAHSPAFLASSFDLPPQGICGKPGRCGMAPSSRAT
jgi:hypothetical protein